VQLITWSADSSLVSLSTANMDANGNNVYSAVSLDGKTLATRSIWPVPDGWISDISPDGRLVAVVSSDMTSMSIYDLGNGNRDIIAISPGYYINNVTFSPDQKYFSVSSKDTLTVTLNSLPSGSEEKVLSGFETAAPEYTAGFKGNSSQIIWQARATLRLQDISSGMLGVSVNAEDFFAAYQLSPDGKVLAGAASKTINGVSTPAVMLWEAATGNEIRDLALPQYVSSLSFSADSSLLAVGTGSEVLVYEVSGGNLLATLTGHIGTTHNVAFSPDGLSLVSSGDDNQLILWRVK
jgi:WD40 repeat protein